MRVWSMKNVGNINAKMGVLCRYAMYTIALNVIPVIHVKADLFVLLSIIYFKFFFSKKIKCPMSDILVMHKIFFFCCC